MVADIGAGLLALVGVTGADTPTDAERLAGKTASLRIFATPTRAFDLTLADAGGSLLCVSQFTLYGDVRRGNRPSWSAAAPPEQAQAVIAAYVEAVRQLGIPVATGIFGAHMHVELENDGPVTLLLDSDELSRPRRAG